MGTFNSIPIMQALDSTFDDVLDAFRADGFDHAAIIGRLCAGAAGISIT